MSSYVPDKPVAPEPVESVPLFGLDNGVWRAAWFFAYVGMVLLAMPASRGACLWQHFMLHAWWWVGAALFANGVNSLVCELVDESRQRAFARAQEAYARELLAVMQKQPIRALERSRETGELEPVYAPLRERPLIDKEMGVRVRT